MQQTFNYGGTPVVFIDKRETIISAKCQPRDIEILQGPDNAKVREAIAVDVRLGQGVNPIGAARGLKHV